MRDIATTPKAMLRIGSCVAVAALVLALSAATAWAEFGVSAFDGQVTLADGSAASQAGSHPHDGVVSISFNPLPPEPAMGLVAPEGSARNIEVELPPGLVGNSAAVRRCTLDQVARLNAGANQCSAEAQVGVIDVVTTVLPFREEVYSVVPPPGVPAMFAFNFAGVLVTLPAEVRPDDYGITIKGTRTLQALPLLSATTTLWGTPADPVHDPLRSGSLPSDPDSEYSGVSSTLPGRPLITLPTACTAAGVGVETKLFVSSWEGASDQASFFSHDVAPNEGQQLGVSGCEDVPFEPSVSVAPTASGADAPTGLDVDISMPQAGLEDPDEIADGRLAAAHLKRARVTLPEGMSINPAAADGLAACTDEQLGLGTDAPVACPDGSRVGSVRAVSPLLAKWDGGLPAVDERGRRLFEEVEGGVFIRSQASSDPTSGEMFRLAIVLENKERGVLVKLPGQVRADPVTGQLVTTFDNNPQLPVSEIELSLKSGPRAPLALPERCGQHSIVSELSSWARPSEPVVSTSTFTIPCQGPAAFAPGFRAGTVNPLGGAFSPFVVGIDRREGDQFLSGVQVDLPKGLVAKLRGVELCPDAVAGDGTPGSCPAGSRIGTATVGAGSGNPFYLSGDVFLTGPYNGAPYGLSVQVPAKAGPFDLGMVKVRQALQVDPETAQVSVVSDPLPQVVKGVPVRLRDVRVDVDRPQFTLNPTSCAEKRVEATFTSTGGAVHKTGQRFQAGDCQALAFKPRMAMRLTGRKQTRTGGHPGFRTVVTQRSGEANIGRVKVTMPSSIALDANNSYDKALVCDYDKAQQADCPASSIIGKATAVSPVLNRAISGPVHLVQGIKFGPKGNRIRTTPALLVKLRGEVAINLRGQTTTERGTNRLVTTFAQVPDAPVSRFDLRIDGGRKGILVVTRTRRAKIDLCASSQVAAVETDGQNGRAADYRTTVKRPCGSTGAANKSKRNRR